MNPTLLRTTALLLLVACGGDSSSDTPAQTPATSEAGVPTATPPIPLPTSGVSDLEPARQLEEGQKEGVHFLWTAMDIVQAAADMQVTLEAEGYEIKSNRASSSKAGLMPGATTTEGAPTAVRLRGEKGGQSVIVRMRVGVGGTDVVMSWTE